MAETLTSATLGAIFYTEAKAVGLEGQHQAVHGLIWEQTHSGLTHCTGPTEKIVSTWHSVGSTHKRFGLLSDITGTDLARSTRQITW